MDHIARHGVTPAEAEDVANHSPTDAGRWLQVGYIFDPPGVVYVIHARPLTDREKRTTRRMRLP